MRKTNKKKKTEERTATLDTTMESEASVVQSGTSAKLSEEETEEGDGHLVTMYSMTDNNDSDWELSDFSSSDEFDEWLP